jgi:Tol biopolymer transport system component
VKIYNQLVKNDKWVNIRTTFDSDNYSTAHPILSPDEKTLYFVSDAGHYRSF